MNSCSSNPDWAPWIKEGKAALQTRSALSVSLQTRGCKVVLTFIPFLLVFSVFTGHIYSVDFKGTFTVSVLGFCPFWMSNDAPASAEAHRQRCFLLWFPEGWWNPSYHQHTACFLYTGTSHNEFWVYETPSSWTLWTEMIVTQWTNVLESSRRASRGLIVAELPQHRFWAWDLYVKLFTPHTLHFSCRETLNK